MTILFKHFIPVLFIIMCCFILTGCPPLPSVSPTWTVMVYMDADNNLEKNAIEDFNEMESVNLQRTGIRVIVLLDRISGYDSSNGDWTGTRLYKIERDYVHPLNPVIISERLESDELGLTIDGNEELNMGDPGVCSAFVDFCMEEYPAEDYFLIFWNHGSGWLKKSGEIDTFSPDRDTTGGPFRYVCSDDTDSDMLYTKEVSDSIEGKGVTVVGFDACYESMLEVAYELRNDADYMIASEEIEEGDGWEYNLWLKDFASSGQSATDLIEAVVDAYASRYSDYTGKTLAGIDLSRVEAANSALNTFCTTLSAPITDTVTQENVRNTLLYDVEDFKTYKDINIDLWHMADMIEKTYSFADEQAIALKTAIDDMIVDEWHHTGTGTTGNPDAHGIALHYRWVYKQGSVYHDNGYMKGNPSEYVLEFVNNSAWVPTYSGSGPVGPGLLYTLWYDEF
ncbi:MAG: hypothetical protein JXB88_02280 [Spirochaetales bacterium]|nr:hypothetical protein [Spirochaetales bacterium]